MKQPTFDADDCPTQETLDTIKNWEILSNRDFSEFIVYIGACIDQHYGRMTVAPNYKKLESFGFEPFTALEIATGGWSINELVIRYINQNLYVWGIMLVAEIRGGLFVYNYKAFKFDNENSN